MAGRCEEAGLGRMGRLGQFLGLAKRSFGLRLFVGVFLQQPVRFGQLGGPLPHAPFEKRGRLRLGGNVHDRDDEPAVGQGMHPHVEAHAVAPAKALLDRLAPQKRLEPIRYLRVLRRPVENFMPFDVLDDALEPCSLLQKRQRNSEQFAKPLVAHQKFAGRGEGAHAKRHVVEGRLQQVRLLVDQPVLLATVLTNQVGDFRLQHRHIVGTGLAIGDLEPAIVAQCHDERGKTLAGRPLGGHGQPTSRL